MNLKSTSSCGISALLLASLAAFGLGCSDTASGDPDGTTESAEDSLIGANRTGGITFPSQLTIEMTYVREGGGQVTSRCSAAKVSTEVLLTSQDCVYRGDIGQRLYERGTTFTIGSGTAGHAQAEVSAVLEPGQHGLGPNLALVVTRSPIFTDSAVPAAAIDLRKVSVGDKVYVTGSGCQKEGGAGFGTFKAATVKVSTPIAPAFVHDAAQTFTTPGVRYRADGTAIRSELCGGDMGGGVYGFVPTHDGMIPVASTVVGVNTDILGNENGHARLDVAKAWFRSLPSQALRLQLIE